MKPETTEVGNLATTDGQGTAVGVSSLAAEQATAVGHKAKARSRYSTAVGKQSGAGSLDGLGGVGGQAFGAFASAKGTESLGAGYGAHADSDHSTAVGGQASTGLNPYATAVGHGAKVAGELGTALGSNAQVTDAGGIAIGADSEAASGQCSVGSNTAPINEVVFRGGDSFPEPLRAISFPATDGEAGLFFVAHTGGEPVVRQAKLGPAGSGPGGVGRALYVDA